MTKEQAEQKAKEIWGEQAFVAMFFPAQYIVGEENNNIKRPYGQGPSWEKAFENAMININ